MENKVYTLGPQFSYSDIVTKKFQKNFDNYNISYCSDISEIFKKILSDENSLGMVPFENMIGGSVRETFIALKKGGFNILGAYDLEIHHCFGSKSENFKKIISHPQSISQCSDFLEDFKEKGIEIIECSSNSKAAEVAFQDSDYAAICSKEAILENKLNLISENVENNSNNVTRFILISKLEQEISTDLVKPKTSLIIEPREERAGVLFEILSVFKIKGINLTKIESLPTGEKLGEYIFFVNVDGSILDKDLENAINFLKTFVNVYCFGSYEIQKV